MSEVTSTRSRIADADDVGFHDLRSRRVIVSKAAQEQAKRQRKTPVQIKGYTQHACLQQCAHLLGLLRELRDEVWRLVFEDAEKSTDFGALLTCRQIYHEAAQLAFRGATFYLDHKYLLQGIFPDVTKLRRALTTARRSMIQKLIIASDDPDNKTIIDASLLLKRLVKHGIRPHTVHVEYMRRFSVYKDQDEYLDKIWNPYFLLDRERSRFLTDLYVWVYSPQNAEAIFDWYMNMMDTHEELDLIMSTDDLEKFRCTFLEHNAIVFKFVREEQRDMTPLKIRVIFRQPTTQKNFQIRDKCLVRVLKMLELGP